MEKEQIIVALNDLYIAVILMLEDPVPGAPVPRPKFFRAGRVEWPNRYETGRKMFLSVYVSGWGGVSLGKPGDVESLAIFLARDGNVEEIARALQAAAEWCRRRAEGRRRHAAEILRQQEEDLQWLEAEIAFMALANWSPPEPDLKSSIISLIEHEIYQLYLLCMSSAKPIPAPKTPFQLSPSISWPGRNGMSVRVGDHFVDLVFSEEIARRIFRDCGGQPRRIRRAIQKIRAATEWCRRLKEGKSG